MVRVPGAPQSQNDVAITSNIVLIKLVIITHSQHNHHTIYAFHLSVHPFEISFHMRVSVCGEKATCVYFANVLR